MTPARLLLRSAREEARLTQRRLAQLTGVAQPTIARIEVGVADPRTDTLQRLLEACGQTLVAERGPGIGVDRTQIRELLRLAPIERLRLLEADVAGMDRLERAVRR
ncbi:MAG: helix-turn-helix domain-containing protein [Acidimicrobiales bacterium]